MKDVKVSVVIPIYKPDKKALKKQINMLLSQTLVPMEIIIVHTEPDDDMSDIREMERVKYYCISQKDFDHAATRDRALKNSRGDFVVFLAQDALLRSEHLIEELVRPFENRLVAISYARQVQRENADLIEKYLKLLNYPKEDMVKSKESIKSLGIRAYFCSDVCSCYRKSAYLSLGGFAAPTILNEDMVMAYEAITNDYLVYYAAHAQVIHSHSNTFKEEFKRSFDIGVFQKDFEYVFESVPFENGYAGYVKTVSFRLLRSARLGLTLRFLALCAVNNLGQVIGRNYKKLPRSFVRRFSFNPGFFDRNKKM